MLIDTHCHLYKEYYDDIESIIKLSKENIEQLSDTGKTTRDITRFTYGTRNLHDNFTGLYLLTVFNHYVRCV